MPDILHISGPYLNKDIEERYRITISVKMNGSWNFTVVGLHTLIEAAGMLDTCKLQMELKAINQKNPDMVKEMIRGGFA